ncbi:MAG: type II toxin-antitoxin system prevent-host-death family antitoxin [Rhodobacterales bacterium]
MKHTSTTHLRQNLSKMMDQVNDDHEPLIITRATGRPAVMISLEDYTAMDETAYLMASPANKKALLDAIARVDQGEAVHKTMEELETIAGE